MGKFKETLGINDLKAKNIALWKALIAEFLGNLLLNIFACGSVPAIGETVGVALSFGFTIFVLVQSLGHVSGGHFNPAVTAGMMAIGNTHIIKGLLYIIVQCLGSIAGSGILYGLLSRKSPITQENVTPGLGLTAYTLVEPEQAFGIELFLGFILVLVVCGVCDPNKPEAKASAALAIGMSIAVGHLLAVPLTGASMNPARSFGVAVVLNEWKCHWVYWVGPIIGGILAAVIYKFLFTAPSLGPLKIIERYTTVVTDEKELKRLDARLDDNGP